MLETAGGSLDVADIGDGRNRGVRSAHRLHAAAEFSLVFSARRVLRGEWFDLHYLAVKPVSGESPSSPHGARIGLVIAKKLARRAVHRNLLKRLAREAFRHAHGNLPPYDLVLRLARAPGVSLSAEARRAWRADIDRLLARLPRAPQAQ